jgi:uncharacterized RDD family membrane protein YckC
MSEATPAPSSAPASGLVYGDVPNRIIAYIIDGFVLFVINVVIIAVLGAFLSGLIGTIVLTAIGLAISAVYFVYTWTKMRATVGMRVLSLQIGTAPGGETISTDQAIRRWLALGAAFSIAQVLATALGALGSLIGLAAFAWFIFLLVTTAQSPTKQGWHDKFANTQVVKAAKSVG